LNKVVGTKKNKLHFHGRILLCLAVILRGFWATIQVLLKEGGWVLKQAFSILVVMLHDFCSSITSRYHPQIESTNSFPRKEP